MKNLPTETFMIDVVIIYWNIIDTKIAKEKDLSKGLKDIEPTS